MAQNLVGWIRLAILLSAVWLVGLGLYTAFSWKYPANVPSPFVDYWYTYDWVPVNAPGYSILQHVQQSTWHQSFDWLLFSAVMVGGLAAIWLLTVGLVWTIRGMSTPANARIADRAKEPAALDSPSISVD